MASPALIQTLPICASMSPVNWLTVVLVPVTTSLEIARLLRQDLPVVVVPVMLSELAMLLVVMEASIRQKSMTNVVSVLETALHA
jgi:hypothetical protein